MITKVKVNRHDHSGGVTITIFLKRPSRMSDGIECRFAPTTDDVHKPAQIPNPPPL